MEPLSEREFRHLRQMSHRPGQGGYFVPSQSMDLIHETIRAGFAPSTPTNEELSRWAWDNIEAPNAEGLADRPASSLLFNPSEDWFQALACAARVGYFVSSFLDQGGAFHVYVGQDGIVHKAYSGTPSESYAARGLMLELHKRLS